MADEADDGNGVSTGDLVRLLPPAILIIALAAFALANTQDVEVDVLFDEKKAPLILVMVITAVVGALIAALVRRRRN